MMKKVLNQPLASDKGDKVVIHTRRELISKSIDQRNVKIQPHKSSR